MGDKYAPRGGLPTKLTLTRNRLLVLIPFSLLLVLLVRNSSQLNRASSGGAPDVSNNAAEEADPFGVAYTLQHRDNLNVQDGRNQDAGSHESLSEEILAAQYDALQSTISTQIGAGEDEHPHGNSGRAREEEEHGKVQEDHEEEKTNETKSSTVGQNEEQNFEDDPASLQDDEAEREDEAELSTRKPKLQRHEQSEDQRMDEEPAAVREERKDEAEVREDEESAPGNRNSKNNRALTGIFEEIRSQSLPYSTIRVSGDDAGSRSCQGKYIYVYDLPPEFNAELAAQCDSLFPAFNLCDFFADSGIGKPVDTRDNGSQIFVPADRWFNTHQYALELVSHARIKRYKCLTNDPNQASLFYIPFYAGLDVIRWNFASDSKTKHPDELSLKLLHWLQNQPSWTRRNGSDHVMVLGKISWDFRRQLDGGDWGSRLLEFPETQQVTKILIERNPWAKQDIGVPHPTFFHPRSAGDIRTWLGHITAQNRTNLVSFVGKERPGTENVRSELVNQCRRSPPDCEFVECNHNLCQVPAFVTKAFLRSEFCMQPVGDSPTRRSVFDSLIAGCIPVLFHPMTAYVQYPWHLPRNESSWSVYISEDEVKAGRANVVEVLSRIPVRERDAMRGNIIETVIPGLLYSAPGSDVRPYKDAFDITIEQLLHRVSQLPALDRAAST